VKNLFSYDSKFMQMLMQVGDFIILNVLFLVCCIPVVTIGAARSALYRSMFDMMEDRGNIYKKFFKSFAQNLKPATPLWLLQLLVSAVLIWLIGITIQIEIPFRNMILVAQLLFFFVWNMLFSSTYAQISVFDATRKQYFLNGIYISLTQLWRSVGVAVLDVFPVFFFAYDMWLFGAVLPVWLFLYFSVATNLSCRMWKKPFDQYVENAEQQK